MADERPSFEPPPPPPHGGLGAAWFDPAEIQDLPLPLVVLSPDGGVVRANRAFTDLLGFAPGELDGSDLEQLLPPESGLRLAERTFTDRQRDRIPPETTTDIRTRSGGRIRIHSSSMLLRDEHGATKYVLRWAIPDHP